MQLKALICAGILRLQFFHAIRDLLHMCRAPHHKERQHIQLEVDNQRQKEAADTHLTLDNEPDHCVKEASQGWHMLSFLTRLDIVVASATDIENRNEVNDCDYDCQAE